MLTVAASSVRRKRSNTVTTTNRRASPRNSNRLVRDPDRRRTASALPHSTGSGRNWHEKQVTQLFLSDDVEPYVLKRETHVFTADGKSSLDPQTTVEVIALDMPYKVLREMKSTAYERTIQQTSKGSNVTLDVICVDVPGGIVARTSKELNSDGHLVRRSMLEMVDYHVVDNDDDGSANNKSAGNGNADNGNADSGSTDNSGDKNSAQNLTRRQAKRARKSGRD